MSLNEQEPLFGRYVDQAIKIAHRVQAATVDKVAEEAGFQPASKRLKVAAGPPFKQPINPKATSKAGKQDAERFKAGNGESCKSDANLPEKALLNKYSRCNKCAWRVKDGESHECTARDLAEGRREERISVMREMLRKGQHANKFRPGGKGGSKGRKAA